MIFVSSGYLLLVAVFAFSGIGKLRGLSVFSGQIADYQLIPGSLIPLAAVGIAGSETACAVLLALPWTRRAGAGLAAVLIGVFLAAMSQAVARGRRIPCGCFGGSTGLDTVGLPTLVRTALLGLVAVGVLLAAGPAVASLPVQLLLAALMLVLIFLVAETMRLVRGERA